MFNNFLDIAILILLFGAGFSFPLKHLGAESGAAKPGLGFS
jgi:hypothetical protein